MCIGVCTSAWQNIHTITSPDPVRPVRQKKPLIRGASSFSLGASPLFRGESRKGRDHYACLGVGF